MTEPDPPRRSPPGDLPPDLPPEYAEAYRRGYERAWATSRDAFPAVPPLSQEPTVPASSSGHEHVEQAEPEPMPVPVRHDDRESLDPAALPAWSRDRQPRWLVPALLGSVMLALVLGAYGAGKLFSHRDPAAGPVPDSSPQAGGRTLPAPRPVTGRPWDGPVRPLSGVHARSSCVLPASRDAAGRLVRYEPRLALDGDFTTAWRCAGDGRGVALTLTLPARLRLAEVGLVPGYAKIDAASGVDRYAENNRLARVRWTFPDGRSVVQRLDASARDRQVQTLRIPPVQTGRVTLELLDSVRGPRNTVAISEIQLSEALG